MSTTTNYNLEKYDAGNAANLMDQYNASMDIIDTQLKTIADRVPSEITLPEGLQAFCIALGLTDSNATTLGTALNHILNKVGKEIYTVTDLGNAKKTAEGFIIPGDEA
jgi:hypothetical protein